MSCRPYWHGLSARTTDVQIDELDLNYLLLLHQYKRPMFRFFKSMILLKTLTIKKKLNCTTIQWKKKVPHWNPLISNLWVDLQILCWNLNNGFLWTCQKKASMFRFVVCLDLLFIISCPHFHSLKKYLFPPPPQISLAPGYNRSAVTMHWKAHWDVSICTTCCWDHSSCYGSKVMYFTL